MKQRSRYEGPNGSLVMDPTPALKLNSAFWRIERRRTWASLVEYADAGPLLGEGQMGRWAKEDGPIFFAGLLYA